MFDDPVVKNLRKMKFADAMAQPVTWETGASEAEESCMRLRDSRPVIENREE